jgi:putative peptidoglycan lipid II flippase
MQDSLSILFRRFTHFLSGTLFSRVTGLARDVVTAYAFGTDASVAALMVAFRLSHCLRRLLGEGALQGAFTPKYATLQSSDPASAARFFCDLRAALSLVLIFAIVIGGSILGALLAGGVWTEGAAEIAWLTLLLLPGLLFICLYGLHAALLQSMGAYWTAAVAPAWLNIGWIAGALALAHLPPSQAMPWLAGAIVIATAVQWLVTLPAVGRVLAGHTVSLRNCTPSSQHVRSLFVPLLCTMGGIAAGQINSALDVLFARYADASGPAYLWYAIRLQQLPLALFGIAIANTLLPSLSRAAKAGDEERFRSFLRYACRSTLVLLSIASLVLVCAGRWLIQLLYARGDFGEIAVLMTEQCLWGYTFALLPTGLVLCLAPAFYAKGDYRTPLYASLASVTLNSVLNAWFVGVMGWGSASIAWGTGISAWLNLAVLSYDSRQKSLESADGGMEDKEMRVLQGI